MKNYTQILTITAFCLISLTSFSQDCWSPNVPTEKPCFIYFLGSGYGKDLETAKNNAVADGLRQAISYLQLTISYEAESKIESYNKGNRIVEESKFKEVIKVLNNPTIERLAQIDICEKSYKKNKKVYVLYRLPKGSSCQDRPDYNEWKYKKIGPAMFIPGVGQWKKKEPIKSIVIAGLFVSGISSSLLFNKSANDNYYKSVNFYGTSPVYYQRYQSYGDRDINIRNISIISTSLIYFAGMVDAKFVNTPKVYVFNRNISFQPYFASTHSGINLSIALK